MSLPWRVSAGPPHAQGDVKVVELTVWPPILGSERDGWAV